MAAEKMAHSNHSLASINDKNYYEVSISRNTSSNSLNTKKKYTSAYTPRRAGSATSLSTLSDSKRPGDYYVQKLSNSSIHLPVQTNSHSKQTANGRPVSGNSILSLPSTCSDDNSLVASSQFDIHDSRLSSLTSNSMTSPLDSPSINNYSFSSIQTNSKINEESEYEGSEQSESLDQVNSSVSTITLKSAKRRGSSNESSINLSGNSPSYEQRQKPKLRSASTSSILPYKYNQRSLSAGSASLTRTKSRYMDPKEKKERLQLRKKRYEENDDDDDILANDLDLVCNVPVIQKHAELYVKSSSNLLSRNDLLSASDDTKYNIKKSSSGVKPCPLPGKLGSHVDLTSTSSLNDLSTDSKRNSSFNSSFDKDSSVIKEENESFSFSTDDDAEIVNNISSFYSERSNSYSILMKSSREKDILFKLPNYIKSQSSLEDLHLMSPEKLNFVDLTRPINLPPKTHIDKSKHHKEFQKVLLNYESNTKLQNEIRKRSIESLLAGQQQWLRIAVRDDKDFKKKLLHEKLVLRKLSWNSLCPSKLRYELFIKLISSSCEKGTVDKFEKSFSSCDKKYNHLNSSLKASKGIEFDGIINTVIKKPLFESILKELKEGDYKEFDLEIFQENFKYFLFIKSLSETGLRKHDEIFLIPLLLILFENAHSRSDIFVLLELINQQIFNQEFFTELNSSLKGWADLSTEFKSLNKFLRTFDGSKEFDNLNGSKFFGILLQLNDKLPLSLSAPSTPLSNHHSFFPGPPSNLSSDSVPSQSSDNSAELNSSHWVNSSSLNLMVMLFQLLIVYSSSPKTKVKNNSKVVQTFLVVIFKYYHINWNTLNELLKANKSIKLNNTSDQVVNINSYMDKWRNSFENF